MSEETSNSSDWERYYKLWCEYEKVAMHFNDLIMRVRTQALVGVAAIAAIFVGFVSRMNTNGVSWDLLSAGFVFLLILWCALWVLDLKYYYLLLLGAVNAIVELEKESDSATGPRIYLSRRIEETVWPCGRKNIEFGIKFFYGTVATLLAVCAIICWLQN
jgi:hypothetical protein